MSEMPSYIVRGVTFLIFWNYSCLMAPKKIIVTLNLAEFNGKLTDYRREEIIIVKFTTRPVLGFSFVADIKRKNFRNQQWQCVARIQNCYWEDRGKEELSNVNECEELENSKNKKNKRSRITLLFWAYWCPRGEFKTLRKLYMEANKARSGRHIASIA